MKKLVRPTGTPETTLANLISRKRDKDALRELLDPSFQQILVSSYDSYSNTSPLFNVSFRNASLTSDQESRLKDLYESFRPKLRGDAIAAQPNNSVTRAVCQLCGINEPGTLDHYLDKATYPGSYVHPWNLVPACERCNSSRKTFDDAGDRRITHLFDDDIDAIPQLLSAKITFMDKHPAATFEVNPEPKGSLADLFRRHFHALKLANRYEFLAPPALNEIRVNIMRRDLTRSAMAQVMNEQADEYERLRGRNDWKVALYRGGAMSMDFLHYCGAV